jgi:hypothetical protein
LGNFIPIHLDSFNQLPYSTWFGLAVKLIYMQYTFSLMKNSKDTSKKTMAELANEKKQEVAKDQSEKNKAKETDVTGQTHTTLKQMKSRLREVPKKSAATKHDKAAYED